MLQENPNNNSLHPVILKILEQRIGDKEQINNFFSWDLKSLPDFSQLKDINNASLRIIRAINDNEKIAIYGDYDVDGTTSCALFYHFFQLLNIEVELIQPSRFIEGYGIHPKAIEDVHAKGIALLITVDCGITNSAAAERALELGLDLIITDHHKDALPEMPKAYAIVNPSRRDEPKDSPLKDLAGVAVAFAVCIQVRKNLLLEEKSVPSIYPLLQFVAIGTICDLVQLTPMNLKLVRHGLRLIQTTTYAGIKSFFPPEERNQKYIPSQKLSFNVGPLINSKGRLDHPEKALALLISDDSTIAYEHFSHLEICNNERKFIQSNVYKEAKEQIISNGNIESNNISIVYKPDWHEGVIGIVASKLVDCFKVPAIVFTNSSEDGVIKASARTAGNLNIFDCLAQCNDLFTKFGGHKAAAGLSMPKENLSAFITKMNKCLQEIPLIKRKTELSFDIEVAASEITPNLLRSLEKMEPFGNGNNMPIFKVTNIKLDSYKLLKDIHVRWEFSDINNSSTKLKGISFNYVGEWEKIHPEEIYQDQKQSINGITLYFELSVNRWKGREYIQLMIKHIEY